MKGWCDVDFKGTYFAIWKTAWDFHKRFATERVDWERTTDEAASIMDTYEGKPQQAFMKSLLAATLAELQRRDNNAQ